MKKTEDILVKKMGEEVFVILSPEERASFSSSAFDYAFKRIVAPRNKIFYSQNRGSYGYFFRAVKMEVKRLIKNKGTAKQIRVPVLRPEQFRLDF